MREFEVPHQSIAALGMVILKLASGRVSSPPAVSAEAGLRRQVSEACVPELGNCSLCWAGFSCHGKSGIKREPAPAAWHENGKHDGNSSHYRVFLAYPYAFPIEASSSTIAITASGSAPAPWDPSSWYFGTVKRKTVPRASMASAHNRPPWV